MRRAELGRLLLTLLLGLGLGLSARELLGPQQRSDTAATAPARNAAAPATATPSAAMEPAPTAADGAEPGTPKQAPARGKPDDFAEARLQLAALQALLTRWLPEPLAPDVLSEPLPDEPDYSAERVFYDQHRLVAEALAALRPQTRGKTDLYAVVFAGDGDEDVFRNEAEYVERLFSQRFDADRRVLVLQNNPATVTRRPLATWSNLELVLDGLLERNRFDPEEDILLLFLTSHGDEDHYLYVGMDTLPLDWIGAEDLSRLFNERPFRWRVSIVSACYSGGFLDGLRNSTSMVITAARADRTSFGCGADSDITFFGKAFFVEGLNQTDSLRGAFEIARQLVAEWESEEDQPASEPQIASTPLIEAKLADWRRGLRLGPPLPFRTAAQADAQASARSAKQ